MPSDVLAELADLPGVAQAAEAARTAVDHVLWDRGLRKVAGDLARQSALRGAWASSAMDGAEIPYAAVAGGTVEDSPMGSAVLRVVLMTQQLPALIEVYARSPLQAWARMNTAAVGGSAPASQVGRPRPGEEADDPLRLGALPPAGQCADRLVALAELVTAPTSAPAVVEAGIIHAELAVMRPFQHASGPVARGTIRLTLAARGLDPDLVTMPESGLFAAGRAKYVRALKDYGSGTPDGVARWLIWFSGAIRVGAEQSAAIGAELAG